jgi:hypothetical protein
MLDPRVPCFVSPRFHRAGRRFAVVVFLATMLLSSAVVHAATVAIVRPSRSSPVWDETVSRLHGELLSVGVEVQMVDSTDQTRRTDARAWFLELATQYGLDGIIDIVGEAAPVAVEVWVKGKSPGQFEVSRVDLEPGSENASERSAIRALEVLRSIFLEIELGSRARKTEPVAPVQAAASFEHLNLELGAGALRGVDGVGLALLPMARIGWAFRPWFSVQAAFAGLGTQPTVSVIDEGSARVAQSMGVIGGCYRWRSGQRVQPLVALSLGAQHTTVDGRADAPKVGHSETRWALLGEGSVGMNLRLYGQVSATVAAHVQWSAPSVSIHFVDKTVASTGQPNLMLSLTLGAWL